MEVLRVRFVSVDRDILEFAWYLGGKRAGLAEDSRGESVLDCTTIIKAASSPSGEHWRSIISYFGTEQKAKQYLEKVEKTSKLSAPEKIIFSNPAKRYEEDDAIGMFDRS